VLSLLIAGFGLAANGYSQSFLTNGLVAYFPFNGNANDASGNGNNGIVYGATLAPDRFGNPNSAYRFDNTQLNAIQATGSRIPRGLVPLTFSIWFKESPRIDEYDFHAPLLSLWDGQSSQDFVIDFWVNSLEIYQQSYVGFKAFNGPTQPMVDGNWHQLVCVVETNTVFAYIDSNPVIWDGGSPPPGTQWNLPPGSLWIGYGPSYFYDGALDEVRIYNRALSSAEVQKLYAYESTPPPLPNVSLIKAVKPAFSSLLLGTNYQLQVSSDLVNWTNQGVVFTATNPTMVYPLYWDVDNWGQLFFRLWMSH